MYFYTESHLLPRLIQSLLNAESCSADGNILIQLPRCVLIPHNYHDVTDPLRDQFFANYVILIPRALSLALRNKLFSLINLVRT